MKQKFIETEAHFATFEVRVCYEALDKDGTTWNPVAALVRHTAQGTVSNKVPQYNLSNSGSCINEEPTPQLMVFLDNELQRLNKRVDRRNPRVEIAYTTEWTDFGFDARDDVPYHPNELIAVRITKVGE